MLPGLLNRSKGLTALEIILALVLVAILSIVSLAWYSDQAPATLNTRADILISHLRYAQMRSMNTSSSWGIEYQTATNSYRLFRQGSPNNYILPGETQDSVQLDSDDVSIGRDFRLFFDSWGQPGSDLAFDGGRLYLNLKMAGQPDRIIRIVQYTGFIE
jgi:hypothetical protein